MRYLLLGFMAWASGAAAECRPDQQTFMSCRIAGSGAILNVCYDDTDVVYQYGPWRAPDLMLSEPISTVDYTPWPGVGRAIWERVAFTNGAYTYTVHAGFDRMFGDETEADHPTPHFGGVTVRLENEVIADLSCERTAIEYSWGGDADLHSAKYALGLEWDMGEDIWRKATD